MKISVSRHSWLAHLKKTKKNKKQISPCATANASTVDKFGTFCRQGAETVTLEIFYK